ncbi:MAG TPA: hypothetical protein VFX89_07625 [Gammaproteobacteria bacterium]|nr:hypothetical protein [Gammaproteobacteria bacterium]
MVSIDNRLKRTLVAGSLSLAGAFAPFESHGQSAFTSNADRQDQIVARIAEQEAQYGPYSPQLLESWTDLARLYHDDRNRALEAAAIAQALQISHATYGLYSLEQVPLLQQMLRSHDELGDASGVWELERELMELAEKHPLDPRTASIWAGIADRRMDVFARYLAGQKPVELVLGCYYGQPNCNAGSRSVALAAMFVDAQSKYERAVRTLIRQKPYDIEGLRALDTKIVLSSYKYRERALGGYNSGTSGRGYNSGVRALQRLYAYAQVTGEPAPAKAAALVQVADWNTLYAANTDRAGWSPTDQRPAEAFASYQQAYDLLQRDRASPETIDELFAPAVPVVLPAFAPNPLTEQPEAGATGFIDVAFDITKYGRSADIRVLDTSTNASRSAKNRLTRLIMVSRFRPQAVHGRLDTSHVVLRYYLNEPITLVQAASDIRTD